MSRNVIVNVIVALVLLGVGAAGGALVFSQVVGGSGEPSQPISAPTLSLETTPEPAQASSITTLADVSTALDEIAVAVADPAVVASASADDLIALQARLAEITQALVPVAADPAVTLEGITEEPATPAPGGEATTEAAASSATGGRTLFRIATEESQVRFILSEMLRGVPTTVIGKTNQIAGDIIVDFSQPSNSQVGMIRINARTFLTDNEFRNRAIRGEILESANAAYEFSEFNPTSIDGLPASITLGEPFTFTITGDLKVRDIVQPVTFEATVTPVSETRLEGIARTTVTRSQFNLVIPNVPGVADVSEEVALEIELVATAVAS